MKRMNISAKPGDPSTFWISDTGNCYRTKKEAETDQGTVVNPDDYEVKTSWFKRNWKAVTISAVVAIIIAAGTVWYIKYRR